MSYAVVVAPDALSDFRELEVEIQEAILDLLDRFADEGPSLATGAQDHELWVALSDTRTRVFVRFNVNHSLRQIQLVLSSPFGARW